MIVNVNTSAYVRACNVLAEIEERTGHGDRDTGRVCTTTCVLRQEIDFGN